METINEFKELAVVSVEELANLEGGIFFNNVWEVLGYVFTYHAREMMYSNNAPGVAAFK